MNAQHEAVLAFIEGFIAEQGYAPTYREIQLGMEWKSPSTAHLYVGELVALGRLRRGPVNAPRALSVVKDAA